MKGFYQPAGKLTACSLLSGQLCQKECPPGRAGHRFCRHGLDPAAFFHLRAFDQRVQAQPGLLLSGLDFICRLADAGRDAADGAFWPLPCLASVYLPGHGALAIFTDYDHQRAAGPSFK